MIAASIVGKIFYLRQDFLGLLHKSFHSLASPGGRSTACYSENFFQPCDMAFGLFEMMVNGLFEQNSPSNAPGAVLRIFKILEDQQYAALKPLLAAVGVAKNGL